MNNIEILEEFIKHYKEVQEKYKDDEIQAEIERSCYFEEVPAEAIENLIQEYKELKEEQKEYEKQLDLDYVEENYIQKSKVKEIIYPTPENYIPLEVQSSEMYKKLEKLVEGE